MLRLELLKEIAPRVTRAAAVLRDLTLPPAAGSLAPSNRSAVARVELSPVGVRDPSEIERAVTL